MKMRVMPRDERMLAKLGAARWLTTGQVARLSYAGVSLEMARRRLRVLRQAGYVFTHQANHMAEALHTLGPAGRTLLFRHGHPDPLRLEKRPPKNLEHFLGINDIRIAVEQSARREAIPLHFFFSCWELAQQGWEYAIIPDGICQVEGQGGETTLLFEYDRGGEAPSYFARTKFQPYTQGLPGLPFTRVVVIAETAARLRQLQKYCAQVVDERKFAFLLMDTLQRSFSLHAQLP